MSYQIGDIGINPWYHVPRMGFRTKYGIARLPGQDIGYLRTKFDVPSDVVPDMRYRNKSLISRTSYGVSYQVRDSKTSWTRSRISEKIFDIPYLKRDSGPDTGYRAMSYQIWDIGINPWYPVPRTGFRTRYGISRLLGQDLGYLRKSWMSRTRYGTPYHIQDIERWRTRYEISESILYITYLVWVFVPGMGYQDFLNQI